jgi:hypothetical protein
MGACLDRGPPRGGDYATGMPQGPGGKSRTCSAPPRSSASLPLRGVADMRRAASLPIQARRGCGHWADWAGAAGPGRPPPLPRHAPRTLESGLRSLRPGLGCGSSLSVARSSGELTRRCSRALCPPESLPAICVAGPGRKHFLGLLFLHPLFHIIGFGSETKYYYYAIVVYNCKN